MRRIAAGAAGAAGPLSIGLPISWRHWGDIRLTHTHTWSRERQIMHRHAPPPFFRSVADDMVRQFTEGPCILDGELLVWNKKR